MKRLGLVVLVAMGTWACSPGDIGMETEVVDLAPDLGTEVIFPEIRVETDLGIEIATNEVVEIVDPWCQPGSGCFGDPCDDNTDCLSGWCVEHMGEGVCSQNCVEECPEGWSCQQVAGTDPDVVYICVSDYANLCKPCGDAGDCQSVAGVQDKCVPYGPVGSFCGGFCEDGKHPCPGGFTCQEVTIGDGNPSFQCVADAGICDCADKSVKLGLVTPCFSDNQFGICLGQSTCAEEGLTDCDAEIAEAEICNGEDDDCDAGIDEDLGHTTCGKGLCEHAEPTCVNGQPNDCDPLVGAADEACNGKDDDCDGETDEDFADADDDGIADCMTDDDDGDKVPDGEDNCPQDSNPGQEDADKDNIGDLCDDDDDNDLVPDDEDCDPLDPQVSPNAEEICNGKDDNCNGEVDEGFLDIDLDGEADCIDEDDDNDDVEDEEDNCPNVPNPDQNDTDMDMLGDACDGDDDGDNIPDGEDNCPLVPNPDQLDMDDDEIGDACDNDKDGDEVLNDIDNCVDISNPGQLDTDGDQAGDICDTDDDDDGEPDGTDCAPADPTISHFATEICNDKDDNCNGVIDEPNADDCIPYYLDVDKDGWGEEQFSTCLCGPADLYLATVPGDCKPFDATIHPDAPELCDGLDQDCDDLVDEDFDDLDDDGTADCLDDDDDGDGWDDDDDNCPDLENPGQEDFDNDGLGDACDPDDDDDGTIDADDCNPFDDEIAPNLSENCDGKDNDCDDVVDNFEEPCLSDCENGTRLCTEGQWGTCSALQPIVCMDYQTCQEKPFCLEICPGPPVEVCNGKDDDCNGSPDDIFTCTPGGLDASPCGNCGTRSRPCTDQCEWGEWDECSGQGPCLPAAVKDGGDCGNCGIDHFECSTECNWEHVGCLGQGECSVNDLDTQSCGLCGTKQRTCSDQCIWGVWTGCEGEGVCVSGDTESEPCGKCGTRSRTCNDNCQWGDWTGCLGQGVCAPLATEDNDCGLCGTQQRVCTELCEWDSYGECTDQGPCAPGQMDTGECGNCGIRSRACNGQCQWNDWTGCSNQGICTPTTKDSADCGLCGTQYLSGGHRSCADEAVVSCCAGGKQPPFA